MNMTLSAEEQMQVRNTLKRLIVEDSGQDLIEYALVAALVGLGAVTAMKVLNAKISNAFGNIGNTLSTNI
jgi:pilus assembly protein Flp/PilA